MLKKDKFPKIYLLNIRWLGSNYLYQKFWTNEAYMSHSYTNRIAYNASWGPLQNLVLQIKISSQQIYSNSLPTCHKFFNPGPAHLKNMYMPFGLKMPGPRLIQALDPNRNFTIIVWCKSTFTDDDDDDDELLQHLKSEMSNATWHSQR